MAAPASLVAAARFSQGYPLKARCAPWSETAENAVMEVLRRKPSCAEMRAPIISWALRLHAQVIIKKYGTARSGPRAAERSATKASAKNALLMHRCNGWTFLALSALEAESIMRSHWRLRFDLFYLFALMEIEMKLRRVLVQYVDAAADALLAHVLRCQWQVANRVLGARRPSPCLAPVESHIGRLCRHLEAFIADSCRTWAEI